MNDITDLISCSEKTPLFLKNLLEQIPSNLYKQYRINGKWCIHEHACHMATGDQIGVIDRFFQFKTESKPKIIPFSGDSFPVDYLINLDLNQCLIEFFDKRKEVIELFKSVNESFWLKEAEHPEYEIFTPYIMLRHRLMHDHYHLYRIEELWLTKDEYL